MLIKAVNGVMMLNTGTYERQIRDSLLFQRVLVLGPAKGLELAWFNKDHPLLVLVVEQDSTVPGLRAWRKNFYINI